MKNTCEICNKLNLTVCTGDHNKETAEEKKPTTINVDLTKAKGQPVYQTLGADDILIVTGNKSKNPHAVTVDKAGVYVINEVKKNLFVFKNGRYEKFEARWMIVTDWVSAA